MKNKTIWDYFDHVVDYPTEVAHNPLPYGVLWRYISSTFLNGMINYVKPINCFVLDRYTPRNSSLKYRNIDVYNKGDFGNWHKWTSSKEELILSLSSGEKEMIHTNINCFGDDIVLLAEIEANEADSPDKYMFFWFVCDVSDCCIGKFETMDPKEQVINSVSNWLEEEKKKNIGKSVEQGYDNGIINYSRLPITFLRGWIYF